MKALISSAIGAVLGVISFYLLTAFVANDWSLAVMQWDEQARFGLVYFSVVGAYLARVLWKFR